MKRWYYLAGVAVVAAIAYYAYYSQQPDPTAYGTAIELPTKSTDKARWYWVEFEYKALVEFDVHYDTIQGLPAPHPAKVIVPQIFVHSGSYIYAGKPNEDFYKSIIEKIDSNGVLYRKLSIKMF